MPYELYSPLSLEECTQRIEGQLQNSPAPQKGPRLLWGRVREQEVSLRLAVGMRNPFAPYFQGDLMPTAGGTLVRGECQVLQGVKIAAIVWAILWLLVPCVVVVPVGLVLGGFFVAFQDSLPLLDEELYQVLLALPAMIIGFPVVGAAFGIGFPFLFTASRRKDCAQILGLLKDILQAEDDVPPIRAQDT